MQTILGFWKRRKLEWNHATEDFVVESEPGVKVLSRASWQPGPRDASPALVLLHGMGGWDLSSYLLSTSALAFDAGFHVIRMNMRGAGGSFEICPRLYHAGLEGDLVAVARAVAAFTPRVALFGASLGGNHTLLALGRSKGRLPREVRAGVAVSPPLDLGRCAEALHAPGNRVYMPYFVSRLNATYARVAERSEGFYEPSRAVGVRTVREFDERITAPYGGFPSADEYYRQSSSGPWIAAIELPTLILAAEDDPMIPGPSVRAFAESASPAVTMEVLPTGGHVGFTAPTRAPGGFWAAERALAFLRPHLG